MMKFSNGKTMNYFCQSCGLKLSADEQNNKSIYCPKCYANGSFTEPGLTLETMTLIVDERLKNEGWPKPVRWFFTKMTLPQLARWRKNNS